MRFSKVVVVVALVTLIGCLSATVPSTIVVYSDVAGPQSIKGSLGQAMVKRTYPYTSSEVMDAAETALFRNGYNIEEKDVKKGRITGSNAGRSTSVAVYVEQVSPKPSTQMTLLVDHYALFPGIGGDNERYADRLVTEIQKVLSTYK
jgi:hypothetical protein